MKQIGLGGPIPREGVQAGERGMNRALARPGETQLIHRCLGVPSRVKVLTLSREDLGLDPGLGLP